MSRNKEPKKKERNNSIWFTGIVLVMVYVILMDSMSGPEEKVLRSRLKEQVQRLSEDTVVLVQEQEAEKKREAEQKAEQNAQDEAQADAEAQAYIEMSQEEREALWKQEGEEILRRFRESGWEKERKPMEFSWQEREIVYLASLPEEGIYLYGYMDEDYQDRGVAVEFRGADNSKYYYYDWIYLTPRMVLPELYWNKEENQLYVSLYVGSGTEFALEELHILQCSDKEPPIDFEFLHEDYIQQLEERFSCTADPKKDECILYDKGREVLKTVLSKWIPGDGTILGLAWGDIHHYQVGRELKLITPLALKTDKYAVPLYVYDKSANFGLYIDIEHRIEISPLGEQQMIFTLGDLSIKEKE